MSEHCETILGDEPIRISVDNNSNNNSEEEQEHNNNNEEDESTTTTTTTTINTTNDATPTTTTTTAVSTTPTPTTPSSSSTTTVTVNTSSTNMKKLTIQLLQRKLKEQEHDADQQIQTCRDKITELKKTLILEAKQNFVIEQQVDILGNKIRLLIKNHLVAEVCFQNFIKTMYLL
jgi:hypothetical protein